MQERYLFKAKRIKDGQWVEGAFYIEPYTDRYYIIQWNSTGLGFNEFIEVDGETVCQCTGLKDKNGNMIWENDILDGFTYPYILDGVHNYYAEVCWFTNALAFGIWIQKYPESKVSGVSTGITEDREDWNPNDWEVIGNTFDNPELLEGSHDGE